MTSRQTIGKNPKRNVQAKQSNISTTPSQTSQSVKASKPHGKDAKVVEQASELAQGSKSSNEKTKQGRKPVFRPILASPFTADWPVVTAANGSAILHSLTEMLGTQVLQDCLKRTNDELPRSSARKTKEKNRRRKTRLLLATLHQQGIVPTLSPKDFQTDKADDLSTSKSVTGNSIRGTILCGLNSVTRLLEERISIALNKASESSHSHRPELLFVCQADISPPALVSHLPLLVATYNAMCDGHTRLIRLPLNSEEKLSDAVHLRRCSVLSLDIKALQDHKSTSEETKKGIAALLAVVEQCDVSEMRLAWLDQAASTARGSESTLNLLQPRIKHVRTSMPTDVNVLKAARKTRRQERRSKRKAFNESQTPSTSKRRKTQS